MHMNKSEKINYLIINHNISWQTKYREVENKLSSQQRVLCLCGRLATGLHESGCQRFKNKVQSETIKELKHLIKRRKNENDN